MNKLFEKLGGRNPYKNRIKKYFPEISNISYRGILPSPKESTSPNPISSAYFRMNPTFDMLFKGQEQLLKQANSYKNSNRFAFNAQDRRQSLSRQQSPQIEISLSKKSSQSPSPSIMKKPEETVQNLSMSVNDEDIPDDDDELTAAAAKIPLDEILGKNSFLKDSLRFNCNETTSSVGFCYQFLLTE